MRPIGIRYDIIRYDIVLINESFFSVAKIDANKSNSKDCVFIDDFLQTVDFLSFCAKVDQQLLMRRRVR